MPGSPAIFSRMTTSRSSTCLEDYNDETTTTNTNTKTIEPSRSSKRVSLQKTKLSSSASSSSSSTANIKSLLKNYHQPNRTKSLDFGMIEIFEFPVAIGDNPHVSSGCPISIDWESNLRTIQTIDQYELDNNNNNTNKKRRKKKTRDQLKLSVSDRAKLLLGAGYSLHEIADATFEADLMKRLRAETNRQQKWDGIHAMMELTGRNLRKLLTQPITTITNTAPMMVLRRDNSARGNGSSSSGGGGSNNNNNNNGGGGRTRRFSSPSLMISPPSA